jgi:hypothetical protein
MTFAPNTAFDTDPSTRGQRVHGNGRRPEREFKPDPELLAEFNRGTQKAIRANRDRAVRERFLDALYIYNEPAR